MKVSQALKKIGFWSNRANDAYAMGEADWANGPEGSFILKVASDHYDGSEESLVRALDAVKTICRVRGIDPLRHRWHPPR